MAHLFLLISFFFKDIERERETEKERKTNMYIICIHTYIMINEHYDSIK